MRDACDHSKQGLESEISPEIHNDPESEVTDGCDPSKSALDKNEVSHENFDMDANDQSKQGPVPEIGTENQNGPESEVTDGRDTYIKESNQPYLNCLTQAWHRQIHLFARRLEEYSDKAQLSAVIAAIQYSETLPDTNLQNIDDFSPDFERDDDDSYLLLWNHTMAPIISKDLFKALPHCPIIYMASQMCNNPKPYFVYVQFIQNHGGKNMRYYS
jgi:hypothetical protein